MSTSFSYFMSAHNVSLADVRAILVEMQLSAWRGNEMLHPIYYLIRQSQVNQVGAWLHQPKKRVIRGLRREEHYPSLRSLPSHMSVNSGMTSVADFDKLVPPTDDQIQSLLEEVF